MKNRELSKLWMTLCRASNHLLASPRLFLLEWQRLRRYQTGVNEIEQVLFVLVSRLFFTEQLFCYELLSLLTENLNSLRCVLTFFKWFNVVVNVCDCLTGEQVKDFFSVS